MITNSPSTSSASEGSKKSLKYFLIKVVFAYALISLGLFFIFSNLLKEHAYADMSKEEVQHISEMVFESMFTAMISGQGKAGIEAAARRMNQTGPGMVISIIRGEIIAQKFGEDTVDTMRRKNDMAIFDVFQSGESHMITKDHRLRYLYPAVFRDQCQQCHTNSQSGQVAAVVEIIYPIKNLKVSTSYVQKLMIAYFVLSLVVLVAFLAWAQRQE